MTSIKPFQIDVSDETLERIREKVAGYVWHYMPDDGGWSYGTNLDYMKELCAYWVEEYDWRAHEVMLNGFSQFTAPVNGIDVHFIHEKGSGTAAPHFSSHMGGRVPSPSSFTLLSLWPTPNVSAVAKRTLSM